MKKEFSCQNYKSSFLFLLSELAFLKGITTKDVCFLIRLVFLGFVFFAPQAFFAATFNVNSQLDTVDAAPGNGICSDASGNCTLRAAIREANALAGDDIINLPAGTFTTLIVSTGEDVNANGDFDITGNTIITGAGAGVTFVEANAAQGMATDRVFDIQSSAVVTIENLTVRNGNITGFGGGIRNLGNLTLKNSVVRDNQAVSIVGAGAGGIRNEGTVTLNGVTVTNNLCQLSNAACFGGGMYSTGSGTVTITNSSVINNVSTSTVNSSNGIGHAAGFGDEGGGTITITNSSFNNNTGNGRSANGGSFGAGIRIAGSTSAATTVNITDTNINNNVGNIANGNRHGGVGAAFFSVGTFNVTLTKVTISGNTGGGEKGGGLRIIDGGNFTLNRCNITNNTMSSGVSISFGGGIAIINTSTVTINDSNITGNTAAGISGIAGGVNNEGSTVTLNNTTVANNNANGHGGILTTTQTSTSSAVTTLNNSTVSGNIASSISGGISTITEAVHTSTTNLNNSTVSGNSAGGSGGGIYMFGGISTVNIKFSTITNNTADSGGASGGDGGGIRNSGTGGAINIKNSIVAGNLRQTPGMTSGKDCAGNLVSGDYNLIGNTSGCFISGTTTNNLVGVDPQLGTLALNGGSTMNHLPAATSPVIDSIPNSTNDCGTSPFNFDQRGVMRPFDTDFNSVGACERGANERGLLIITSSVLPNGQVGATYNQTLTADFGNGAYTFSLASGSLPPNLTLMPNGTLTGTPMTAGNYTFTVQAQDSNPFVSLVPNVAQKNFQLQILPTIETSVSIGGRITTADGRGINNVRVSLNEANGNVRTALTGAFGYYQFDEVQTGQTVTISISAKRFTFSSPTQILAVMEDVENVNFIAQP